MDKSTAKILVAKVDDAVCIKLEGRATFACSVDFKRLLTEAHEAGAKRFVINLSACQIMDSTFLGMLSGLGRRISSEDLPPEKRPIELLNPTERVSDLIDNLGVSDLFHIMHCDEANPTTYDESYESGEETSKIDMTRNCLEAHQILMDLNPDNVTKFKDVAKYFEEEVKKAEAAE